ncbi:MAG TPA: hypothetical protein VFV20_04180, partial [Candidatus Limnocylindria bacterium]|nr:hypothetical protein [Candidatus Limnocylindria bacterium]
MFSFASMDRYELAWAAGFFDGEGWAASARFGRGEQRRPQARVNQAGTDGVPEVLTRFRAALQAGRLGGPYRKTGRRDMYCWEAASRNDVELIHHLLAPWLGQVKLLQFATALARASLHAREARPDDEWRSWAAGLYDGEGCSALLRH